MSVSGLSDEVSHIQPRYDSAENCNIRIIADVRSCIHLNLLTLHGSHLASYMGCTTFFISVTETRVCSLICFVVVVIVTVVFFCILLHEKDKQLNYILASFVRLSSNCSIHIVNCFAFFVFVAGDPPKLLSGVTDVTVISPEVATLECSVKPGTKDIEIRW